MANHPQQVIESLRAELNLKNQQLDDLTSRLDKLERQNLDLLTHNNELQIKLQRLELDRAGYDCYASDRIQSIIESIDILDFTKHTTRSYITWDEYFMSVAQLAGKRSKDPSTQVGACIVNSQNKIIATGYNGMPNGVRDDMVPWIKEGPFLETKYAYVVHAELNAILNCTLTDQTNSRVYVSLFPCNECAKAIIQSGIRHVIYLSDKHKEKDSTKAAKTMFQLVGVTYESYSDLCARKSILKPQKSQQSVTSN